MTGIKRRLLLSYLKAAPLAAGIFLLSAFNGLTAAWADTPSAAQAVSVSSTAASFAWALDNPALERPLMVISTAADFSVTYSSVTGAIGAQTTSYYSLSPNTTYYFKVKVSTEPDENYTVELATVTRIEAPAGVYFDEVSSSAIVASAYGPVLTGLGAGLSGAAVDKDAGGYSAWRAGDAWTAKPAMTPRRELAAAAAGGKLYALGGNGNGGDLDLNEEYDPASGNWAARAPMTAPRPYMAAAAAGGKIYALGGVEGILPLTTNEEYDPETNSWTPRAGMPTARRSLAAVGFNGKIYAIGGTPAATGVNEEYDPETDAWTVKADMPSTRYELAAAAVAGRIYALGGTNGSSIYNKNEEYNPAANSWAVKAAMPTARKLLAAAAAGGKVYAFGGTPGAMAVNEEYNPAVNAWVSRADVPTARFGMAAAAAQGRIYALGGYNGNFLGQNEEYDPGVAVAYKDLIPNTRYEFTAKARNIDGTETPASAVISTYTLAAQPGLPAITARSSATQTLEWSDGGNPDPGTAYRLKYSVSPAFLAPVTTVTVVLSTFATVDQLTANTSYYFSVAAVNDAGVRTLFAGPSSAGTLAATPGGPYLTGRSSFTQSLAWDSGGNPDPGTSYRLKYSTSADFIPPFLVVAASTFATVTGLDAGTSYYYDVAALNNDAIQTDFTGLTTAGYTLPAAPGTPVPAVQDSTSILWDWEASTSAITYRIYCATAPLVLKAVQAAPPYLQLGLSTNTSNGIIVSAVNLEGEGLKSPPVSTYTFAAAPVNLSSGPALTSTSTMEMQWDANQNPAGTQYRLDYWTLGGSTTTITTTLSSAALSGLLGATSYYFTVRARSGSDSLTPAGAPLAMPTLTGAPTGLAGAGWTADSIRWTWNSTATAAGYKIYKAGTGTLVATVAAPPFIQTDLSSNTLNGVQVAVVNLSGESEKADAVSTYTLAAVPGEPAISASSDTAQTVIWDRRGNPYPDTHYRLKYSTTSDFQAAFTTVTVVTSTITKVTGLIPNTSYFYDVAAVNNSDAATPYTEVPVSSYTMAAIPGGPVIYSATDIRQSVSWAPNGNPDPGTSYRVRCSTSPLFEAAVTTAAVFGSTFTTFLDLTPNTSYYYEAAAINRNGVQTGDSGAPAAGYTLAAVPGYPAFTGWTTTTQDLEWPPGVNPEPGTSYQLERSTSSNFTRSVSTAVVVNSTFTQITGLTPDTSYYYRVAALNGAGVLGAYAGSVLSGYTLPPAPSALAGAGISVSSVSWTWTASAGALKYRIYQYPPIVLAEVTGPSYIHSNISTNTITEVSVSIVNPAGEGERCSPVSTHTLAALPGNPVITLRSSTTQHIEWADGVNPVGTGFLVKYSTSPDFAAQVTGFKLVNSTFTTVSGLLAGTSYYYDVAAVNGDGISTSFTNMPAAAYTLPPAPGAPAGTPLGVSSVQWTWAASTSATSYNIYAASETATMIAAVAEPSFLELGLSTNTSNGILVAAVNLSGEGLKSVAVSTYTLAAPPGNPSITARSSTTQTVTWDDGTNPDPGTSYLLKRSTSVDFFPAVTTAAVVTSTFPVVMWLDPGTSYYYDVAALNHGGVPTDFTGAPAAGYTLPSEPGAPAGAVQGVSSISWTWAAVDSATGYRIYAASETETLIAAVPGPAYLETGLSTNTSNGILVAAENTAGEGLKSPPASAYTLAAVPGAPAITARSSSTQHVEWGDGTNPASGTSYRLKYSTAPDFDARLTTTVVVSSTFTTAAGLLPNTSYYYAAAAVNSDGLPTQFTGAPAAGYTLAGLPGAPYIVSRSSSEQTVAWNPGANPEGTGYRLKYSTSADFTASVTTTVVLASTFTTATGLAANTSYYYDAAAFNADGLPTQFTGAPAAGYTLAGLPGAPAITAWSSTTQHVEWSAGGNPDPGTSYALKYSTSANFTAEVTTAVVAASTYTTVTGLEAGASYYYDVAALNAAGFLTAFTGVYAAGYTLPAAPDALTGLPLDAAAISWSWAASASASAYKIYAASDATNIATVTVPLYVETGLSTNTSNGILVSAVNLAGEGLQSPPVSTYTLSALPLDLSTGPVAVTSNSVTVQWNANTNPPGIWYRLDSWAETGATVTARTTLTSATVSGLQHSTSYYFRVRAENALGTLTAPAMLVAPTLMITSPRPFGTVLGPDSISWNWNPAATALGYNLYPSSEPATLIGSVEAPPFVQTGLEANSLYSLRTAVVNGSGIMPQSSNSPSVRTFAYPPGGEAVSAVYITSAVITWELNNNPPGVAAEVQRSTDNLSFATVLAAPDLEFTDEGLAACTSYYFRIRNKNNSNVYTLYSSTLNFLTKGVMPLPPGSLTAESLAGNLVRLAWEPSLSGRVTHYSIYYDSGTGTIDYLTPLAVVASSVTSYTTGAGVLVSSAAYRFGVRAELCGTQELNTGVTASAAAMDALAALGAAVKVPQSGRKITGNRVTVMAELTAGAAAQVKQVSFQYKASTSAEWLEIPAASVNHPNPDTEPPYLVHWNVLSLATTGYDLRAVASDLQDVEDSSAPAIGVTVTAFGDPEADISENSQGAGSIEKTQRVHNAVANVVQSGDAVSSQVNRVLIPAGALSASTVTVTVVNSPAAVPPAPADAQACGAVLEISLSNSQKLLSGGQTAAVTLSFKDDNGDGLEDVTGARAETLRMYSAATLLGPWQRDFASYVDLSSKTVTGNTPHFSFFALFVPLGSDLDDVEVYPVPYVPNDADPYNGKPYVAGDFDTGIVFDGLPASAGIKIYTLTGQLVAHFSSSNSSGKLQWNVKNDDGKDAASGGYLAVISSPGHKAAVKKLLVVR